MRSVPGSGGTTEVEAVVEPQIVLTREIVGSHHSLFPPGFSHIQTYFQCSVLARLHQLPTQLLSHTGCHMDLSTMYYMKAPVRMLALLGRD